MLFALAVMASDKLKVLYGVTEKGGPGAGYCGVTMDTGMFAQLSPATQSCFSRDFIVLYGQCFEFPNNLTNVVLPRPDSPAHTVAHDHPTAKDWQGWQAQYSAWRDSHASQVDTWLDRKVPANFSGVLAIDYESWQLDWTSQVADHGTRCDSCGAWVGQPGTNDCNSCNWMNFTAAASTPVFDPALLNVSGFVPPPSSRGWADLSEAQQSALLAGSWRHFARSVYELTLQRTKQQRPAARVGWYGKPSSAAPGATPEEMDAYRAGNDELAWLWAASDWLGPSVYAKRWTTTSGDAPAGCPCSDEVDSQAVETEWMTATLSEMRRVQKLHAPTAAIIPWITWSYGFSAGAACRCVAH